MKIVRDVAAAESETKAFLSMVGAHSGSGVGPTWCGALAKRNLGLRAERDAALSLLRWDPYGEMSVEQSRIAQSVLETLCKAYDAAGIEYAVAPDLPGARNMICRAEPK